MTLIFLRRRATCEEWLRLDDDGRLIYHAEKTDKSDLKQWNEIVTPAEAIERWPEHAGRIHVALKERP